MEETSMQADFTALQEELMERGEAYVSELIGQDVDFSAPASYPPAEETINQFQQLAETGINQAIANYTGEEMGAAPSEPVEGVASSLDTQQQLIQAGIDSLGSSGVGNVAGDPMTTSGESTSGFSFSDLPTYDFKFVPGEAGTGTIGEVQLTTGTGEPTTLFTLGESGPVSSGEGFGYGVPSFVTELFSTEDAAM